MKVDVSILIVSYNTRDLTLACLRSVYAQTQGVSFEVLVVDNDSRDSSVEAIGKEFPAVRLFAEKRNLGFAGGTNFAASQAEGEYLLLLNPDTVILDGAIQREVQFAREHPEAAIFGGRTLFGDGSLNYNSCHGRPTPWSLFCLGVGLASVLRRSRLFNPEALGVWKRDTVREVDAVSGCFLLMKRELWAQLGGFDKAFFMYGEETDLCLRARRLGYKAVVNPGATLIHYGGASEKVRADKMVRLFRAKAQLFHRHWRKGTVWFGVWMLDCWAFTRMVAMGLLRVLQPRRSQGFEAWRDIWRRRGEYHLGRPEAEALRSTMNKGATGRRILVVASGGGHWIQLMRLKAAFEGCQVTYLTTLEGYRSQVGPAPFHVVRDASRWNKAGLVMQALSILLLVVRVRPHVVVTTGAAPGYFAIRFGKWLGAKTIWIDSIANVDELSLSGQMAGKTADLWLTQWPHLAKPDGPYFAGAVL
jgi:GT2 family glycosyltransferase